MDTSINSKLNICYFCITRLINQNIKLQKKRYSRKNIRAIRNMLVALILYWKQMLNVQAYKLCTNNIIRLTLSHRKERKIYTAKTIPVP